MILPPSVASAGSGTKRDCAALAREQGAHDARGKCQGGIAADDGRADVRHGRPGAWSRLAVGGVDGAAEEDFLANAVGQCRK